MESILIVVNYHPPYSEIQTYLVNYFLIFIVICRAFYLRLLNQAPACRARMALVNYVNVAAQHVFELLC
jgi:uncharacterized protein YhhL (DUF1145 family)